MTLTTLVTGARAALREAAIAAQLDRAVGNAVILEGLPDGTSPLEPSPQSAAIPALRIARIAPGCPCCNGNLTMRVTLNRILRHPPQRLFIGLASSAHLDRVRAFLMQAPYNEFLELTKDIAA